MLTAPLAVQLDCDDDTMILPDIVVLCDKNKITPRCIFGAPDMVVEVLSSSTRKRDLTESKKGRKLCWEMNFIHKMLE